MNWPSAKIVAVASSTKTGARVASVRVPRAAASSALDSGGTLGSRILTVNASVSITTAIAANSTRQSTTSASAAPAGRPTASATVTPPVTIASPRPRCFGSRIAVAYTITTDHSSPCAPAFSTRAASIVS